MLSRASEPQSPRTMEDRMLSKAWTSLRETSRSLNSLRASYATTSSTLSVTLDWAAKRKKQVKTNTKAETTQQDVHETYWLSEKCCAWDQHRKINQVEMYWNDNTCNTCYSPNSIYRSVRRKWAVLVGHFKNWLCKDNQPGCVQRLRLLLLEDSHLIIQHAEQLEIKIKQDKAGHMVFVTNVIAVLV